jgi:hypothetical protein
MILNRVATQHFRATLLCLTLKCCSEQNQKDQSLLSYDGAQKLVVFSFRRFLIYLSLWPLLLAVLKLQLLR